MTTIGLVGGTGDLGTALAVHLSKTYDVILGSRSEGKAKTAVADIIKEKGNRDYFQSHLKPADNQTAVRDSDIVFLTVPYDNAFETIQNLSTLLRSNQILISTAASVSKSGEDFVPDFPETGKSVSEKIFDLLGGRVEVAAAFQTVPANRLYKEAQLSSDVLIAASNNEAYQRVADVVKTIEGLRPLYAGSLTVSAEVERLTSLLLNLAKRNGLKSPSIKISSF